MVCFEIDEIAGADKSEIITLTRFTIAKSAFPINKMRKVKTKSPIYNDFWPALFIKKTLD